MARARPARAPARAWQLTGGPPQSGTEGQGSGSRELRRAQARRREARPENRAHPRVPRSVTLRFVLVEDLRLEREGSPS
jgi:hypothetical protein